MKSFVAEAFRILFRIPLLRKRYFGIRKIFIEPLNLSKNLKKTIRTKSGLKMNLIVEDWIQEQLFYLGNYEVPEHNFLKRELKLGDVFIDVGANIGLHSMNASMLVGKEGRVISFEPFQRNYDLMARNIFDNDCTNITLEKTAISSSNKEMDLYYDESLKNFGAVSSYRKSLSPSEKVISTTLDSYIEEKSISKVNLVKLDIEGAEYPALIGMNKMLRRDKPTILIEIDQKLLKNTPYSKHQILEYLHDLGYVMYYIDIDGRLSFTNNRPNSFNFVFK